MLECVDYSSSRPSPAGLVAARKHSAGRYIGPGTASKHLTAGERAALHAAGLSIFLLIEGAAGDAAQGYNLGAAHAQQARNAAAGLGAPSSCALYFAVDFNVTAAGWPPVAAYLRGAASIVGADRVGIYGGYRAVTWAARDGVAAWFFQTYAWSDIDGDHVPDWFARNHIEQYRNGQIVAGGTVDLCRSITANFGQWAPPGAAAQLTRGDDMPVIVRVNEDGGIWCTTGPHRYWYTTQQQFVTALKLFGKTGADVIAINRVDLVACGIDVTAAGQGGLTLSPDQLAAISTAAEDGAARGAATAIDGATIRTATR